MEVLSVKNLNFRYESTNCKAASVPKEAVKEDAEALSYSEDTFAIRNMNLVVQSGELVLFCGPCGCGKTTFFRLLKEELRPAGIVSGSIENRYGNAATGYLFQNPDSQLVCRTVEEELVFGAENMGMPREEMARAVAEISAYLGIEQILHAETAHLSGGQKQMVNLASILLMKPKLLLLDEPVSQLDPVSTYEFIQLIRKLKDELGITILIIEHNLDAFLKEADRVIYMEEGQMVYDGGAAGFLDVLRQNKNQPQTGKSGFWYSMPETVKVWLAQNTDAPRGDYPLTVGQLRNSLDASKLFQRLSGEAEAFSKTENGKASVAVSIRSGYFRYEKHTPDILKNLSLTLEKGRIYSLIGGNGTGKSTLFSVLSGYRKLYRGKCKVEGRVGVLPQNPSYAFFKDVLMEDLQMVSENDRIWKVLEEYDFCSGMKAFLHKNPLDLSGGQMQKAAIVKMLLNDADLLLMDEPVKAMDGYEKHLFAALLKELQKAGKTIFFITHDLEFAEAVADSCLMLFDGRVIAMDSPKDMFRDNRFYTTVRGRIRGMVKDE